MRDPRQRSIPFRSDASLCFLQQYLPRVDLAGHICNHALLQQQLAVAHVAATTADLPAYLLLKHHSFMYCIVAASDARACDVCIRVSIASQSGTPSGFCTYVKGIGHHLGRALQDVHTRTA